MAILKIVTKAVLPDEHFDAASTTHLVGCHFKTFINALEASDVEVSFEVTTETGGLKPVEPKRRGPDKAPRRGGGLVASIVGGMAVRPVDTTE